MVLGKGGDDRNTRSEGRDKASSFTVSQLAPSQHLEQGATGAPRVLTCPSQQPPKQSNEPSCDDLEDEARGYNSEDEYQNPAQVTEDEWTVVDTEFAEKLLEKGWFVKKMGDDGACLFRAVADQVFGDQEMHSVVRKQCMDYLIQNRHRFQNYLTENLDAYVARKRNDSIPGNHIELQALSEMFNRAIEVYCSTSEPITIFNGTANLVNEPIRLEYYRGYHYNSIVDPHKPTVGVGLDVPNITPELPGTNLMKESIQQSEESVVKHMPEDETFSSNLEATEKLINELAEQESYIQWLEDNEKHRETMHMPEDETFSSNLEATEKLINELAEQESYIQWLEDNEKHRETMAMLEETLIATNLEETDEVILEQAARESYLQLLKDDEKQDETVQCASADIASATVTSAKSRTNESGVNKRLTEEVQSNSSKPKEECQDDARVAGVEQYASADTASATVSSENKQNFEEDGSEVVD